MVDQVKPPQAVIAVSKPPVVTRLVGLFVRHLGTQDGDTQ
jgi:hypothetical protein